MSNQLNYIGSDEDIRSQFEKYLYSLLAATQIKEELAVTNAAGNQKGISQSQIYADYK